jgi:hypothetical protein
LWGVPLVEDGVATYMSIFDHPVNSEMGCSPPDEYNYWLCTLSRQVPMQDVSVNLKVPVKTFHCLKSTGTNNPQLLNN